ncbi:unnamed protein product [Lupinus luteus]|uniref:Serine-threonine kinase receptor-associated protein n=1 Tax=Lupinus luteus TaxID=3873 RepID=A0AAV1VQP2_LUPLU
MENKKVAVPLVSHGHSRPVVDLFYSPITPDGFFLISASKDSSPMLRNGESGDWIGTFQSHKGAHEHIVRACAFSEDTHLLLTRGVEKILRIYDMNGPDAPPREVDKSLGSVRTVAWLHSDETILSSCSDMGGVRRFPVKKS